MSIAAWAFEGAEGVPFDAIVILAILVLNAILGYVQEARAEEAVSALQRMAAPTPGVRRDGRAQRIATTELVPGDVLLLAEGDAVSADGRLVEAASLMIAEAALTGESEPVLKDAAPVAETAALGDRLNMVFNGTAVRRGRGVAVVTATGMSTEMGKVARLLGRTESEQTPLQREVADVGRTLGRAVIMLVIVGRDPPDRRHRRPVRPGGRAADRRVAGGCGGARGPAGDLSVSRARRAADGAS